MTEDHYLDMLHAFFKFKPEHFRFTNKGSIHDYKSKPPLGLSIVASFISPTSTFSSQYPIKDGFFGNQLRSAILIQFKYLLRFIFSMKISPRLSEYSK